MFNQEIDFLKECAELLSVLIVKLENEINNDYKIQHLTLLKLNDIINDTYEEGMHLVKNLTKFIDY